MKHEWGVEKCIGLLFFYLCSCNHMNNILNVWNMNNIKKKICSGVKEIE
jgi:hypothetical protein